MEILIIAILIVAAILFMLVEFFVIPGFSIAGIASFGCFAYAIYYAFANISMLGGFITLAISAILGFGSLALFMRSKTLDKLALKKNITSVVDKGFDQKKVKVGDTGVCITRLAQIGNAEINGQIMEVKTIEGLLDVKTPIVVVRITDNTIFVERQHKH